MRTVPVGQKFNGAGAPFKGAGGGRRNPGFRLDKGGSSGIQRGGQSRSSGKGGGVILNGILTEKLQDYKLT